MIRSVSGKISLAVKLMTWLMGQGGGGGRRPK